MLSSNTLANANTALYSGGAGGVSQLIAGSGIVLNPPSGQGVVTVSQQGGAGVTALNVGSSTLNGAVTVTAGSGITLTPSGSNAFQITNSGDVIDQVGNGTVFATPSANGTATIWEVGNFLFCAVAINPNTATPGFGQFTLPSGLAWINSTATAVWPQVIASAVGNGTGGLNSGIFIASAQPSQPTSPTLNNRITAQCTDATGAAQVGCMINVLAFGPKA